MSSEDAVNEIVTPAKSRHLPTKQAPNRARKKSMGAANRVRRKTSKYDWENIREMFVEGVPEGEGASRTWLTLKEVSARMNVPYQQLRNRSSMENWSEARSAYQVTLERDRQKKRAKELSREAVDFDGKSLAVSKMGMSLVSARLGEIARRHQIARPLLEQAFRDLDAGIAVPKERLWSAINHRELVGLAQSAQLFQQMGRTALGEDVIRHVVEGDVTVEHDIQVSERLKLDDPERLGLLMAALEDARLLPAVLEDYIDEQIEDADIVDDEPEDSVPDAQDS